MPDWYRPTSDGIEVTVHAQPGATRDEIAGLHGDALKLRIAARAVEGAANEALARFLATHLGLPRRAVRILCGEKSRRKTVWLAISPDEIERLLTPGTKS